MPTPRVVLVGPPGAGKSTIGRRLARALHAPLTDTDHMIEEREGDTCASSRLRVTVWRKTLSPALLASSITRGRSRAIPRHQHR